MTVLSGDLSAHPRGSPGVFSHDVPMTLRAPPDLPQSIRQLHTPGVDKTAPYAASLPHAAPQTLARL